MLSFCFLSFAQEVEFKFNENGFTDYVVTKFDEKSKSELYKKTIEWVAFTFNTPKKVIKAKIENEYIRIEGSSKSLICFHLFGSKSCNNATFQIEIYFKSNRYKFDLIEIKQFGLPSKYSSGGWYPVEIVDIKPYYKKGKIRKNYRYFPVIIPEYFNSLNNSLKNYILNGIKNTEKDNW